MFAWLLVTPESPYFLVSQGKLTEAGESLRWLRSTSQDTSAELRRLELQQKDQVTTFAIPGVRAVTEVIIRAKINLLSC